MYPAERTLTRQIRRTLYMLKRQYGGTIDIYTLNSTTSDPKTGIVTTDKSVVRVDRAPVLPARMVREVRKSISEISANKMFVTGGTYDASRRVFIVDRRDVPGDFNISNNSYVVYRNRKYDIETYNEFEFEAGWVITGRQLDGERPEQIYCLSVDNLLDIEQGGTNGS